jgi:PHP family Zn ribbon phosphoesterase
MEQHNIDSRFKQGLENVSRQPSADAWARLQSRMQEAETAPPAEVIQPEEKEERKVIAWWYYAAAAVVLLLVSVGILKNSTGNGPQSMPLAVNQATKTESRKPEVKASQDVVTPEINTEANTANTVIAQNSVPEEISSQVVSQEIVKQSAKKSPAYSTENGTVQIAKTNPFPIAKENKVDPGQISEPKEQVKQQEEKVLLAAATEKPASVKNQMQPSGSLGGMVIEVVVKKDPSAEALAANTTTSGETETKPALIKSLFQQAKSLKNGEGVNFQALGLSADSKLAQGTKTLHDKVTKVLDI